MCLVIARCKHKRDSAGNFTPFTAEEDIHVYKQIVRSVGDWRYYTFCRLVPVIFKKGICEMTAENFTFENAPWYVYQGIHARRSKTMDGVRFIYIHHAVIPKGTQYFLGTSNDIVALKLIAFASESDYDKYCKENNTHPKDISRIYTGY